MEKEGNDINERFKSIKKTNMSMHVKIMQVNISYQTELLYLYTTVTIDKLHCPQAYPKCILIMFILLR